MNASEIASSLRTRVADLGLSVAEVADRAGCRVLDVNLVLSGDEGASVRTLVAVSEAVGYVLLAVPEALRRGIGDGFSVTEPRIETKVSRALKQLRTNRKREGGARVVLFCDLDGAVHKAGDSRIDDAGNLVGDHLFRWWPQLKSVLDEFPQVEVVVHSSWRKYFPTLQSLQNLMPEEFASRVVALTNPHVLQRQDSINEYLLDHPEVTAWVILDDEPSEFNVDCPNLIACHPQRGVSDQATVDALRAALKSSTESASSGRTSRHNDETTK